MTSSRHQRSRASRVSRGFVWLATVPLLLLAVPEPAFAAAGGGEESLWSQIARLANFAILVGTLVYFLKRPIMDGLAASGAQVRQELAAAAEMRTAASAQLAAIEKRMQALPAELEALQRQGAEDVAAERARMAAAAAVERERLLEQMRREIDMRLRIARRDLTAHAAALAIGIAEQRIRQTITPDDQMRLVDRYTAQLQEAR